MKKIAIYGKGGIAKSTVTGNLAVAFAPTGYRSAFGLAVTPRQILQ